MNLCRNLLLLTLVFLCKFAFTQRHVDVGFFNDWDYGPGGVYGDLKLPKTAARTYYRIVKTGPGKMVVTKFNPSGVAINTATVTYLNGRLSEVDEADKWGEIYEYRHYQLQEKNIFRVTILRNGSNAFLPGKYALYTYTGDLLTEIRYYSSHSTLRNDKNGIAIIRYKRYDDPIRFAEIKETAFFDAQQQPAISKANGSHKLLTEYDDHDNEISESHLGVHDEPVLHLRFRIAKILYTYDSNNNLVFTRYYGLDNNPAANAYGVASTERTYEGGYEMKQTRFDVLGHVTKSLASGDGVAVIKHEYDTSGNEIRESYFDEQDKPMNNQEGIHEEASIYVKGNLLTQTLYFDQNGDPCVNNDHINSTNYVRDQKGRIICQSNYGLTGKPLKTTSEQVYMLKYKYDQFGRETAETFWADTASPMAMWDGSYEVDTKYDEDGQETDDISIGIDGKPYKTDDGSSTMKLVYDADGRIIERQFLFGNDLAKRIHGVTRDYSIIKYGYDENNRVTALSFWETEEKPVDGTILIYDSVSAHRVVLMYNGATIVEEKYFKFGATEPFRVIDCLKKEYLTSSGISTTRNEN